LFELKASKANEDAWWAGCGSNSLLGTKFDPAGEEGNGGTGEWVLFRGVGGVKDAVIVQNIVVSRLRRF